MKTTADLIRDALGSADPAAALRALVEQGEISATSAMRLLRVKADISAADRIKAATELDTLRNTKGLNEGRF